MVVDLDGEGPAPLHGDGQTIKFYNIVSESLQYEGYSRTRNPSLKMHLVKSLMKM
jgi:hypothetical protein